jgi:hypothetical protein
MSCGWERIRGTSRQSRFVGISTRMKYQKPNLTPVLLGQDAGEDRHRRVTLSLDPLKSRHPTTAKANCGTTSMAAAAVQRTEMRTASPYGPR